MKKATSFIQPMKFTGTYPGNWPGYTFLQQRTPEGHPELRHIGVDYNYGAANQDIGFDAICAASGVVEKCIKWNGAAGYGNHVFIRHELSDRLKAKYGCDVLYSHYAHLNDIACQEGQDINKGDLIGHVGNSGTQYGHLHVEIRKPTGLGYESYPSDKPEDWLRQYYFDPYLFIEENKTEDPDMTSQLEACQLQVKDEIKKKNETYQTLQEIRSDYEGAKAQADSAKKQYTDLLNELATILGISAEHDAILGQVGKLIKEEEQLTAAQKAEAQVEAKFTTSQQELVDIQQKYKDAVSVNQQQAQMAAEMRTDLDVAKQELGNCQLATKLKIVSKIFGFYIAVEQ